MLIDFFPEAVKPFFDYVLYEFRRLEKTIVAYGTDLKDFERYLKETDALLDLTKASADNVRNWMVRLMGDNRNSAASVNRKLSSLRSYYRFLLRKGVVKVNPMLKVVGPKKKKPLPSFVREKDMDRLLDGTSFA